MTLDELKTLKAQLEAIHALTADGILALRERITHDASYTNDAKVALDARMAQRIGAAQLLADKLPDSRSSAP